MRNKKGGTLALVTAAAIGLILIGVGLFFLSQLLGGQRELQNATNSGALNVAKQAIQSPSVGLLNGVETDNFAGLVNTSGQINLLNYNRAVAQAMLVALNAEADGSVEGKRNATTLIDALHGSEANSLSNRLNHEFNAQSADSNFLSLAISNSLRMLGMGSQAAHGHSDFQIAYAEPNGATNVHLDPSILPEGCNLPSNALSNIKKRGTNQNYISGYSGISVAGIATISGASVQPDEQPHLIAQSTFSNAVASPVSVAVPPNAFRCQASAAVSDSILNAKSFSCSIVGALNTDFEAAIPRGYIVVYNPPGVPDNGTMPSTESIFTRELATGIFVANNGAFTTDQDALQRWIDYNNGDPATRGAEPSREGIFGADPSAIRSFEVECDYTNSSEGATAIQPCEAMLPAFRDAYRHPDATGSQSAQLIAVEKLKADLMHSFPRRTAVGGIAGYTGLRFFPNGHEGSYPTAPGGSAQFTVPGTISQLLTQIGDENAQRVMRQLKQRMKEIKPSASDEEIETTLNSHAMELGETAYIYLQNNNFIFTTAAPPWMVRGQHPDGTSQHSEITYQTLMNIANPVGEAGLQLAMYTNYPNPQTTSRGKDEAFFIPSSGFNNLLGYLEFRNSCSHSGGTQPIQPPTLPPPPPPPPTETPPQAQPCDPNVFFMNGAPITNQELLEGLNARPATIGDGKILTDCAGNVIAVYANPN